MTNPRKEGVNPLLSICPKTQKSENLTNLLNLQLISEKIEKRRTRSLQKRRGLRYRIQLWATILRSNQTRLKKWLSRRNKWISLSSCPRPCLLKYLWRRLKTKTTTPLISHFRSKLHLPFWKSQNRKAIFQVSNCMSLLRSRQTKMKEATTLNSKFN